MAHSHPSTPSSRRRNQPPPPKPPLKRIPLMILCCCVLLLLALAVGLTELRLDPEQEGNLTSSAAQGETSDLSTGTAALREAESLAPQEGTSYLEDSAGAPSNDDPEAAAVPAAAALTQEEETGSITPEQALEALNDLRDTFPEGMYWNHVGVEDWDEFTVTNSPCDHDIYWDTYCNGYSGGIQDLFPQFVPMEQCLGFAALLSDLVFGEDAPVSTFTDYTQVRSGDHIRLELSEHSMTVLTVEEDGITVVECNSDYQHCRISWDRFLSWDDLSAYAYEIECITRYED
ncbi:MAG: hypothetical protein ACOYJZ_01790 [Acutalibacter sp.]|jgi:hypothetical protein